MIEDVAKLLGGDVGYFEVLDSGKLQCKLNGHTMPTKSNVISSFLRCDFPTTACHG